MSFCLNLKDKNGKLIKDPTINVNSYFGYGELTGNIEINIPNNYFKMINLKRLNRMSTENAIEWCNRISAKLDTIKYNGPRSDIFDPSPENLKVVLNRVIEYSEMYPNSTWVFE